MFLGFERTRQDSYVIIWFIVKPCLQKIWFFVCLNNNFRILVHYARLWNGLPTEITREGKTWEAGAVFESDIFTHTLTLNAAKDYAKQYGWNF